MGATPIPDDKITPTLISMESIHDDKIKLWSCKLSLNHNPNLSKVEFRFTQQLGFWFTQTWNSVYLPQTGIALYSNLGFKFTHVWDSSLSPELEFD